MSKNITLFGQDFSNVPSINVPLQGGGTASFIDEDDAGGGLELTSIYTTGTFTEMECNNSRGYANTFYIRDFIVDPENSLSEPPMWFLNMESRTITLTGADSNTMTLTIPQADLFGYVEYGASLQYNETTNNYDLKFKTSEFLWVNEATTLSISLSPITLYDGTSETKTILRFEP